MKRIKLLLIAVVGGILVASTGVAPAALIVGGSAPAKPAGEWLDWTLTSGFTKEFTVPNIARPDWTKYLWMEVTMDSMNAFPQAPGDTVNVSLWPSVSASGSVTTITGAADVGYNNPSGPWVWYLTATIDPQPASEVILFPDAWWNNWGTHITQIDVYTACIPEPTTMLAGALLLLPFGASAIRFLRKQRTA